MPTDDFACTPETLALTQGTMTIAGIDAGGLSFSLYQALVTTPTGTTLSADGPYQATSCP